MKYFFLYIIIINYIAYSLFHIDKDRAIKGRKRISEKNLLIASALGGSFGSWLGMQHFRHKTKKTSFKISFYIIIAFQLFLLLFVFRR
ncbi:DUF1294 domain-containing protein [Myroides ceti]|uniref:DUF1294 domain-containing protein n=1 Tax=Paenimyroides ceti TaxID=395087 RepID=A0ABT8CXH1_9FLAO|nr:DUF1294 domain-containing protein [Paenimyroides ceti]MDN3708565.1 DUF1294 domain-containing protein [Paenimyroides ceti]MDN3708845.1 DUF1294 domain-containing protein [Paenimyroides ceti]MDN3708930.1 DUF1294 domain-containing protein [Paenimyroides ceti]